MASITHRLGLPVLAALALTGCVVAQPVAPGPYVGDPYAYEALPPDYYGYLDGYGAWRSVPGYSAVWCPQVASIWSPYYYGPAPPWSFTFYFGDWISTPYGWGWIPGYSHHPHWHRWADRGHGYHHRYDDRHGGHGRHATRRTYERRRYDGAPRFESRGHDRRGRDQDDPREVRRGGHRDDRFERSSAPRRAVAREHPVGPTRHLERREPRSDRRRGPGGGSGFRPPGVPIAATRRSSGGWRSQQLGTRERRAATPRRASMPGRAVRSIRSPARGGSSSPRAARSSRTRSGARGVRDGGRGGARGGGGQQRGRR